MGRILGGEIRYAVEAPGCALRGYRLFGRRGQWIADAAIEYQSAGSGSLTLHITGDYGNYGYRWDACGRKGYAAFLLSNTDEYIAGKLAAGHNEAHILRAKATREAAQALFMKPRCDEDADWMGEALCRLDGCECEADFYCWAEEYGVYDIEEALTYGWGWRIDGLCGTVVPALKASLREEAVEDGEAKADERAREERTREDPEGAA